MGSLCVRLRSEVTLRDDKLDGLTVAHAWGETRIDGAGRGVARTLRTLTDDWVDGAALRSMCMETAASRGTSGPWSSWAFS